MLTRRIYSKFRMWEKKNLHSPSLLNYVSKTAGTVLKHRALSLTLKPQSIIPFVPISNLIVIRNTESERENDGSRGPFFILRCFSVAGLVGILGGKTEDGSSKMQPGEEKIIEMIKMAKLCQERNEFKKSEQFLHLALRTAYEIQHHDAQQYIIDEMANNAYEARDFKKAERLFIDLMKNMLGDGVPPDDNAIIHISAKLANLYAKFQEDHKAKEGFLFCINCLEAKVKKGADDFDTLALYSLILSWFGDYIHSKGDFVQSLSFFQRSHEISVKINGEHHPHSLLQLNNMAASFTLMDRLEDALGCLKEVLALVQENQLGDGMDDLPYYYINVVNIYLTQVEKSSADSSELLNQAASYCQEALKWAKVVENREALIEAKKSLKKIEHYQSV